MAKKRKNTKIKKKTFAGFLRGEFLTNDTAGQNWKFMLFLVGLAFISITSAHSVDKKVVRIAELKNSVSDLKTQYTDKHSELMQLQLESSIISHTQQLGLELPSSQPYVLIEKVYVEE
ncbi:FtsL-like putative cell division protein [Weeksella virosa]|uniref:FtsL-like putative cell division protein n=1 Tax=Weeksella virosa TaxID=1014 RepID=UPI002555B41C|nr:FtsL-like putative cell division protein [Weeksella virosa]MDK7374367.1 FtsL-like putative cell division protein [Weeksella virosa]